MPSCTRTVQIKAKDLQNKNTEELKAQLEGLKQDLLTLRVAKVSGKAGPSKLSQLKVVRKNVARVLTVVHQKERKAVAAAYKGKKYMPKDLRNKSTSLVLPPHPLLPAWCAP